MIAVDSNILVYAHRADSKFHHPAATALKTIATGRDDWAIPWPCLHEFLSVVTRPGLYDPPTDIERALTQVRVWVASPSVRLLGESDDHWEVLGGLLRGSTAAGLRVYDARIAAICIANGVSELWTSDRDFNRFPIRIKNPVGQ